MKRYPVGARVINVPPRFSGAPKLAEDFSVILPPAPRMRFSRRSTSTPLALIH